MPNQDLIDYENNQIQYLNEQIVQKNQLKEALDSAIAQSQSAIDNFNAQKDQADIDISDLNSSIDKVNQIILILEAQP